MKPLIWVDAGSRNEAVSQTQYSIKIKKLKLKDFVEKTDSEDTELHKQNIDSLRVQKGLKLPKFVYRNLMGTYWDGNSLRNRLKLQYERIWEWKNIRMKEYLM